MNTQDAATPVLAESVLGSYLRDRLLILVVLIGATSSALIYTVITPVLPRF